MKTLIAKFENLKNANFIGISEYKSEKSGEIANYVVCTNISVENAKKKDLEKLQTLNLQAFAAENSKFTAELIAEAHAELLASAIKNLNSEISERSAQSQGQTDAFIQLFGGLKLHKDTLAVHIFGMSISKTVIVPGEYKTVKSSDKTICKKAIKKFCKLRAESFRTFILTNAESVSISNEKFDIA
jgi:hypothetical protein